MLIFGYDCHSDGPLVQPKEVVMAKVALCEIRGLLIDTIEKLSGDDGTDWAERLKSALRKNDLLRRLGEVAVSAVKEFVVADNFKVGNAGISSLGENFEINFLGRTEKNIKGSTLLVHRLEKVSIDAGIRAELITDKKETSLAYFYELLSKQSKGEAGSLLTNGYANIFYVRDVSANPWAIIASWDSCNRGWGVIAFSMSSIAWVAGVQVFSPK